MEGIDAHPVGAAFGESSPGNAGTVTIGIRFDDSGEAAVGEVGLDEANVVCKGVTIDEAAASMKAGFYGQGHRTPRLESKGK